MNSFVVSVQPTAGGIALTWPDSPGAAGYEVLRRAEAGDFVRLAAPGEAAYLDTDTVRGTEYTYRVDAVSPDGSRISSWPVTVSA